MKQAAQVNDWLAFVVPHVLWLGASLFVGPLFGRRFWFWLANDTPLLSLGTWWYPLIMSMTLLQQLRSESLDKENAPEIPKNKKRTSPRYALGTRSTNSKQRQSPFFPRTTPVKTQEPTLPLSQVELQYWWRYWCLYALVQAFLSTVRAIPLVNGLLSKCQAYGPLIELGFWTWVHTVPFLIPNRDHQPLYLLTTEALESIHEWHEHTATLVTRETWQNRVVVVVSPLIHALKLVRVVSTTERLERGVVAAREYLVPLVCLGAPLLSPFGIVYLQFLLPLAQQSKGKQTREYLQFWILSFLWTSIAIVPLRSLLWWIPFSQYAVAGSYLYLDYRSHDVYENLEDECQLWGLLPGKEGAVADTRIARWTSRIMKVLPKAKLNDALVDETAIGEADAADDDPSDDDVMSLDDASDYEGTADEGEALDDDPLHCRASRRIARNPVRTSQRRTTKR